MDEQDDIRLRDEFAKAAMQALVENISPFKCFIEDGTGVDGTDAAYISRISARVGRLATVAYKIADEMRKARLATFK